jgi:plastocyanin
MLQIFDKEHASDSRGKLGRADMRASGDLCTAVVKAKDQNGSWKAEVDVVSMSQSGAGFHTTQECFAGQLVSMMLPMPSSFRRYDLDQRQYKIWGLVQHCSPTQLDGEHRYHVGVAFIGKNAPPAYHRNPLSSFRVSGIGADGLWEIAAAETPFKTRKSVRFWRPLDIVITLLNADSVAIAEEATVTENISQHGASVFANIEANVGDRVKFLNPENDFHTMALVRNRQVAGDGRGRLHLQFIDNDFPVRRLGPVSAARE